MVWLLVLALSHHVSKVCLGANVTLCHINLGSIWVKAIIFHIGVQNLSQWQLKITVTKK